MSYNEIIKLKDKINMKEIENILECKRLMNEIESFDSKAIKDNKDIYKEQLLNNINEPEGKPNPNMNLFNDIINKYNIDKIPIEYINAFNSIIPPEVYTYESELKSIINKEDEVLYKENELRKKEILELYNKYNIPMCFN